MRRAIMAGVHAIEHGSNGTPWNIPVDEGKGMALVLPLLQATTGKAALFGWKGKIGTIAKGAFADLITVTGDQAGNIKLLEKVPLVMKNGMMYKQ